MLDRHNRKFSFTHWPEDSLRDFGRKTLGQVLENEDEGEAFVELLAHCDAGTMTDAHKTELYQRDKALWKKAACGSDLERWRFWRWLKAMADGYVERHTVSVF